MTEPAPLSVKGSQDRRTCATTYDTKLHSKVHNWLGGPGLALGHPIQSDRLISIPLNANEYDPVYMFESGFDEFELGLDFPLDFDQQVDHSRVDG
jgi:hypothetical protein